MPDENRVAELALPWAAAMPDDDLHHFLGDLVAAAMHRWHHNPDVPDREVLALVERACAQWRTPGQGWRSDAEDADTRLAEIAAREAAATPGLWESDDAEIYQLDEVGFRVSWVGETLDIDDYAASKANSQFASHARADVPWLLAEVIRLREQLAKVAAYCAQRAEYVSNLREFVEGGEHDYYRWTGHAEARRQLSRLLGLPVGWPVEDQVEAGASDGR